MACALAQPPPPSPPRVLSRPSGPRPAGLVFPGRLERWLSPLGPTFPAGPPRALPGPGPAATGLPGPGHLLAAPWAVPEKAPGLP